MPDVRERRDPALMGGRYARPVEPASARIQGNWVVTRENSSRPIGDGGFLFYPILRTHNETIKEG